VYLTGVLTGIYNISHLKLITFCNSKITSEIISQHNHFRWFAINRIATGLHRGLILIHLWYALAIRSHQNLSALGLILNTFFHATTIYDMRGLMEICHLVPPHLLKGFAISSNPTMWTSQSWNLTCSNFCIRAQIWVSFTPLESKWWTLRSEAKFNKILTLWILSIILSTWSHGVGHLRVWATSRY